MERTPLSFRGAAIAALVGLASLVPARPAHAAFQVADTVPCVSYTVAIAAQTDFEFGWPVIDSGDLRVFVEAPAGAAVEELDVVNDYSVTGVQQSAGGEISLEDGLDIGDVVTICRATTADRITDFSAAGTFKASNVEVELNNLQMQIQDIRQLALQALQYPLSETKAVGDAVVQGSADAGDCLCLVGATATWSDPDCDATCTLERNEFDVGDYGAVCDGTTNDTAAIVAADAAAGAAGGGVVSFKSVAGKTCVVRQTDDVVAPITISGDNITYRCAGATIKATSTNQPDSQSEESNYATVFRAVSREHLLFEDCHFDGNRDAATDPRMAFLKTTLSSHITVRGGYFANSSNVNGALSFDGDMEDSHDIRVEGATFYRCDGAVDIYGPTRNIFVINNTATAMDLTKDGLYTDVYGSTRYLPVFRYTGFTGGHTPTVASDEIDNINFIGNTVDGGVLGIEIWNNNCATSCAANGSIPEKAHNVTVANNTILALSGIYVNAFSNVTITGNAIRALNLDTTATTAYAGLKHGGLTTTRDLGVGGVYYGIEARPGYGMTIANNSIDMQWASTYTHEWTGIAIGTQGDLRSEYNVLNNTILNTFKGISALDMQDSMIAGNQIQGFTYCSVFSIGLAGDYNSSVDHKRNTFLNNHCSNDISALVSFVPQVLFSGGSSQAETWAIVGNVFEQKLNTGSGGDQLNLLLDSDYGQFWVIGNQFLGFRLRAVWDDALTSYYDGNTYDTTQTSFSTASAHYTVRRSNKTVKWLNEKTFNMGAYVGFAGAAASSESYSFGTVFQDANQNNPLVSFASGTVPAVDVRVETAGTTKWYTGSGSTSSATANATIRHRTGSPEANQSAPVGSIMLRDDGTPSTAMYTKGTGTTNTGWNVVGLALPSVAAAADDTTPTVKNTRELVTAANTGATAITQLDDGVGGQTVCIRIGSATNPSTVADSGNFKLTAAWSPGIDDVLCVYTGDGTTWREISRADN